MGDTRYAVLEVEELNNGEHIGWQAIEVPQETTETAAGVLADWRSNTTDGPSAARVKITDSNGTALESVTWFRADGAW